MRTDTPFPLGLKRRGHGSYWDEREKRYHSRLIRKGRWCVWDRGYRCCLNERYPDGHSAEKVADDMNDEFERMQRIERGY